MVRVIVGVALAGIVTSSVSGTAVGGSVAVGEEGATGVLVPSPCGGSSVKEGPPLPPPIRMTSVATSTTASAALIRKPGRLAGRNRMETRVSKPNIPAQAKYTKNTSSPLGQTVLIP